MVRIPVSNSDPRTITQHQQTTQVPEGLTQVGTRLGCVQRSTRLRSLARDVTAALDFVQSTRLEDAFQSSFLPPLLSVLRFF